MCGRYRFTEEQSKEIRKIIEEVERKYGEKAVRSGEIRPTAKAPVLTASEGGPSPELYTWGFRLPNSLVINARAETAMEKPMFRESVVRRRCVVPSTGFWEWDADKRKYFFTLSGAQELYMAGLYDVRDGISYFCILTTAANESMREVHGRMPLILTKSQIVPWLQEANSARELLYAVPPDLKKRSCACGS